jgi:uncharacterized membrane protein
MKNILSPQKIFLIIASIFGFLVIVFTPPFEPQDEICHFQRAWQVSTGNFSAINRDHRLGGYVPKSMEQLLEEFNPYFLNNFNKITPNDLWHSRLIPLNSHDTVFVDFPNTALYSSILYIPQSIGISIGKLFNAGPFWLLYFGRVTNYLFYLIIVFLSIKIMPVNKWLFMILALLPISLTTNSSLSADTLVNSLSLLTISIILYLAYSDNIKKITVKNILLIFLLSFLIGHAKLVYIPILMLLVLIPTHKFGKILNKVIVILIAISIGVGTVKVQKSSIDSKYLPYSEYNLKYRDYTCLNKGCDINKQIDFIKVHPLRTVKVFIKSFFAEFVHMVQGYICLTGWGHNYPPQWAVWISFLLIFFVTIFGNNPENSFSLTLLQRSYLILIAGIMTALVMLSQYLSWDIVGEDKAYPFIGRYFIPILPLFFISIIGLIKTKYTIYSHNISTKLVIGFCILCGILNVYLIIINSYTLNQYPKAKWEISFSLKNDTLGTKYIVIANDTIASLSRPDKSLITDEKHFTGNQSVKISDKNPYGFTVRIFKGYAKDKIVASCRSFGYGGFIDFQEFPAGINYFVYKTIPERDSLGWKYHEAEFILQNDITKDKEFRVFMWWPNPDSIYLDDFKVAYYERD